MTLIQVTNTLTRTHTHTPKNTHTYTYTYTGVNFPFWMKGVMLGLLDKTGV